MSYLNKFKETKAFTLIELLVVIAIIGILSSVVLASLNGARESARDTRRGTDLSQIATSLEMYTNDCSTPPSGTSTVTASLGSGCSASSGLGDYMSQVPNDPSGGAYGYAGSGATFCVAANLEGTDVPDNDSSSSLATDAKNAVVDNNGGSSYAICN